MSKKWIVIELEDNQSSPEVIDYTIEVLEGYTKPRVSLHIHQEMY